MPFHTARAVSKSGSPGRISVPRNQTQSDRNRIERAQDIVRHAAGEPIELRYARGEQRIVRLLQPIVFASCSIRNERGGDRNGAGESVQNYDHRQRISTDGTHLPGERLNLVRIEFERPQHRLAGTIECSLNVA